MTGCRYQCGHSHGLLIPSNEIGIVVSFCTMDWKSKLYLGEIMRILRECLMDTGADLASLYRPSIIPTSTRSYFSRESGEESAAQATASWDVWQ